MIILTFNILIFSLVMGVSFGITLITFYEIFNYLKPFPKYGRLKARSWMAGNKKIKSNKIIKFVIKEKNVSMKICLD